MANKFECYVEQWSWDRSTRCGCQQSATLFDRWIRALLASTELKAHGHVTTGLALTQLKGGGGSGASHHMLPYHFPLNMFPFPFLFHSWTSPHPVVCLSHFCYIIHTAFFRPSVSPISWITRGWKFLASFPLSFTFPSCSPTRSPVIGTVVSVDSDTFDSWLSQIKTTALIGSLPVPDVNAENILYIPVLSFPTNTPPPPASPTYCS